MDVITIPKPCKREVEKYLNLWDVLENYTLQESALNKLFGKTYPYNNDINEILIKASVLNDFYSTNIYDTFSVAKHILSLNIDSSLNKETYTLVDEIACVKMRNGSIKRFYSFASKYCSHHYPEMYPIYDSYVDKILRHFRKIDKFCKFTNIELKNYVQYIDILNCFKTFYDIEEYTLKEIDKYLWQLGKEKFPKKF